MRARDPVDDVFLGRARTVVCPQTNSTCQYLRRSILLPFAMVCNLGAYSSSRVAGLLSRRQDLAVSHFVFYLPHTF